jgi:SpoVK/Ycf46/Vps4 family AAA+-type ATPase
MEAIKKRQPLGVTRDARGTPLNASISAALHQGGPRDRVEDLLSSIIGLDHIKSQVRGLRRSTEISDLKESLLPAASSSRRGQAALALISPALSEMTGRPRASHMVFVGNPGTGKTAVARLLAKAYHELGLLRKPKFLEVERMDLVGRDKEQTVLKTREVLDEARGGVLFIDEAYTLGMASKRNKIDTGNDAMAEIIASMQKASQSPGDDTHPLVILAGFPVEMQTFLSHHTELRKNFALTFEFPDYSCDELAKIFCDLASAKGFDLDDDLDEKWIAKLLNQETTPAWRGERNGRVCELLMAGCRTQVRRRMRTAQMEGDEHFDPHQIIRQDIEAVMTTDFK